MKKSLFIYGLENGKQALRVLAKSDQKCFSLNSASRGSTDTPVT